MASRIKAWALSLICCATASQAVAQDFLPPPNSYVSLNAGRSKSVDTCTGATIQCSESSNVYRIAYGYHFTPTWGMEVSYGDFGKAEAYGVYATPPSPVPGTGPLPYVWNWDAVGWEIAATGTLHLGESISLIGKVGFVRAFVGQELRLTDSFGAPWHAVSHEDSNSTSGSIGIQYDFSRSYALRLQYADFGKLGSVNKIKVRAASADIVLKF